VFDLAVRHSVASQDNSEKTREKKIVVRTNVAKQTRPDGTHSDGHSRFRRALIKGFASTSYESRRLPTDGDALIEELIACGG